MILPFFSYPITDIPTTITLVLVREGIFVIINQRSTLILPSICTTFKVEQKSEEKKIKIFFQTYLPASGITIPSYGNIT